MVSSQTYILAAWCPPADLKPANVLLKSDRVHGKRTVIAKVRCMLRGTLCNACCAKRTAYDQLSAAHWG